jgi:hypothetical protein
MPITKAQRRQILLGWSGIALTWAASLVFEIAILGRGAVLAVAVVVTTAVALAVGVQLKRRVRTPIRRASITVSELRGRFERR